MKDELPRYGQIEHCDFAKEGICEEHRTKLKKHFRRPTVVSAPAHEAAPGTAIHVEAVTADVERQGVRSSILAAGSGSPSSTALIPAVLEHSAFEYHLRECIREFQPVGYLELMVARDMARHLAAMETWNEGVGAASASGPNAWLRAMCMSAMAAPLLSADDLPVDPGGRVAARACHLHARARRPRDRCRRRRSVRRCLLPEGSVMFEKPPAPFAGLGFGSEETGSRRWICRPRRRSHRLVFAAGTLRGNEEKSAADQRSARLLML